MSTSFHNFLPFRTEKPVPDMDEIEPRPGLEPLDDLFDEPYDFPDKDPEPEAIPEFHHSNMTFWWFVFGAIFLSFFLYTTEFHVWGVPSCWYKNLKKYPGSPDSITIMLGNAFLAFMLAWSGYQMFKNHNRKIIRYGGVFLMVAIYILVLMWALLLYSRRRPRNAMFFLTLAWLLVGGFIILSLWSEEDNYEIILPLGLAFLWILYLMYYTAGIVNENDDRLFGNFDDIFGPEDELDPRNPKNYGHKYSDGINFNRKIHRKKRNRHR